MSKLEIDKSGTKRWYNEQGKFHREDGPAIEYEDGTRCWYINDLRHREDGPAITYPSGTKIWYSNGFYHREDGPAIEFEDGERHWYYHGIEIKCKSNEEFLRLIKLKAFW